MGVTVGQVELKRWLTTDEDTEPVPGTQLASHPEFLLC